MLITVWAALKLLVPLHRDTALFLWTASQIDQGAVLYRDIWDVKQPGIFLFNDLGGRLFGFTAEGVRLFECLWLLGFAGLAVIVLRRYLTYRWLAIVGPVAFLGGYYVFAEPYQQGQLEALVGLPLFLCAAFMANRWQRPSRRMAGFLAAGIAAGIATAFKHVLAPIPVAMVLVAGWHIFPLRRPGSLSRLATEVALPFACGVCLVWGALGVVWWQAGALDAFLDVTFAYPLEALAGEVPQAPASRLFVAVSVYAVAMAPWLPFAAFAALRCWRRPGQPLLFVLVTVWLVAGAFVILIQKTGWWGYYTLLLYPPTGILAVRGIDLTIAWFASRGGGNRFPALALSTILVVSIVAAFEYPAGQTARGLVTALLLEGRGIESYRREISSDYANAADAAAVLEKHAPPGPIYVFGDPTILSLTGRPQAIPIQGSAWDFFLPAQWQTLPGSLAAGRPVWIFLETHSRPLVEERSPETMRLLARDYRVVWDQPYGRWYARADLVGAGADSAPASGAPAVPSTEPADAGG